MRNGSITCFTQDETVLAKSVSSRVKRSPGWYGRTPASVSLDVSISSEACRVYSIMALKTFQGSVAKIGMRQLGILIGKSPATAMRRVKELVSAGHLRVSRKENGKRCWYEFTSPVFAQKQRAGIQEVIHYPRKRMVSVRSVA